MKRPIQLAFFKVIAFLLSYSANLNAQTNDTLIGVLDGELIKINQNDGGISSYQTIPAIPAGDELIGLTWCSSNSCYYSLYLPSGVLPTEVAIIDDMGNYSIKGTVTVPGETISFMDGITFNSNDGYLYVSASLDGGPPTNFWCETLLRVDTTTLVGTVIGTFSHTGIPYQAEADKLEIGDDNKLYYLDGEGGSSPYAKFYQQDLDMLTPPVLLYQADITFVSDLSYKDGEVYFSIDRVLRKIDPLTSTHTYVGTMFSSTDFGGSLLRGLDWRSIEECEVDATVYIAGRTLVSNQDFATYQWMDCKDNSLIEGATGQSLNVPYGSGSYAVIVEVDGCIDTSQCTSFQGVGLEESEQSMNIYPNPTKDNINIVLNGLNDVTYTIEIIDITGKIVLSQNETGNSFDLSLAHLESGTYFIRISNESIELFDRIVLE